MPLLSNTVSNLNIHRKRSWWEQLDIFSLDAARRFVAEVIGTGLLVLLGCMGCIKNEFFSDNSHMQASLNFGLVVLVIIQSFGCVSGAHLNPAVTVAAYIYELVTLPMAAVYFVAQMLGAVIGYGLLMALVPANAVHVPGDRHALCVTAVHPQITVLQGLGIEFVVTSVLVLVCCGVWDPSNADYKDSIPVRFGLIIVALSITAGRFTGASMNPARSFGPALWNNDYEAHWIYWAGPLPAGVITAAVYNYFFRHEEVATVTISTPRRVKDMSM